MILQELQQSRYEAAGFTLQELMKIDLVDNTLVTRLLNQAKERVKDELQELRERAMQSLMLNNFEHAAEGAMFGSLSLMVKVHKLYKNTSGFNV